MKCVYALVLLFLFAGWDKVKAEGNEQGMAAPETTAQEAAPAPVAAPKETDPAVQPEASGNTSLRGDAVADFLEYRWKIKLQIEENWKKYLEQYRGSLKSGKINYRFYVNDSGSLTIMSPRVPDEKNLLEVLAFRSIAEVNKNRLDYPKSIRSQYPRGFFDEVTFKVN